MGRTTPVQVPSVKQRTEAKHEYRYHAGGFTQVLFKFLLPLNRYRVVGTAKQKQASFLSFMTHGTISSQAMGTYN